MNVNGYVRTDKTEWVEGEIQVETPAEGTAASADSIKMKGLDSNDERPVLVLTLNSKKETAAGGSTVRFLANVLDATNPECDALARETQLFRCIKIDATDTPVPALAKWKLSAAPSMVVLTAAGEPVASIPTAGITTVNLTAALDGILKNNFKDYFAKVQAKRDEVKKIFTDAQAHLKKGEVDAAKSKLNEVIGSRVGSPLVAGAQKILADIEAKEKAKEQANAAKENKG